jgi:CubicO group peptidase (beta-lactamase class C family)
MAQIGLRLLALAFSVQLSVGSESPRANTNAASGGSLTDAELKTMLQDYIENDKEAVALVVGIVDQQGSRVVSHGKFDARSDRDVDGDTLFAIGSITKVFTGLLLQDMIERGEMNLDDSVQKYLPNSVRIPTYEGKDITLLHLATHTSGLPRDSSGDVYPFLSHCNLRWAPGTRREYSNLGVGLLGHLIALKAGKDYETLVIERICKPLGMNSTKITLPPEIKTRLAPGHAMPGHRVRDFSSSHHDTNASAPTLFGAGGIRSTANDLLKFVAAYAGLTPSPLNSLMEKAKALHTLESGGRARIVWEGDSTVFEHGGLLDGYQAELAFDEKKRRGVVILSNCANYSTTLAALWPALLDGRSPRPANLAQVEPTLYDRYTGQYHYKHRAIWIVRREGNRLMLQWIGLPGERVRAPTVELFPTSESVFRNEFYRDQATFIPDSVGRGMKLILVYPEDTYELARLSSQVPKPPPPIQIDAKIYKDCVGQYRWTCLFKLIRIGPTLSVSHKTDELGEHLFVSAKGYGSEEVFPVSETTFILNPTAADDLRLAFVRNRKGKVTGGRVCWNGSKYHGTRISSEPAK